LIGLLSRFAIQKYKRSSDEVFGECYVFWSCLCFVVAENGKLFRY